MKAKSFPEGLSTLHDSAPKTVRELPDSLMNGFPEIIMLDLADQMVGGGGLQIVESHDNTPA
jgi:hypothetical protein